MGVSGIGAFQEIMNGFDFSRILSLLLSVIPALICITLHELSHGLVALWLGDDTAKRAGRLTLNPIKHLDPMGLVMMVAFHVGYAKPVPVNMYRFKNPKRGMALTALAGPVSNLLIAAVFLFLYGLVLVPLQKSAVGLYVIRLLNTTAIMSIGLAIFNFLPIPPLDGSKVLLALLPDESYAKLMRYERYGSILVFALAMTGALGGLLNNAITYVYNTMFPIAYGGYQLAKVFMGA